MKTVAVIVGSLRRESINRKLAEALGALASDRLSFTYPTIGDLPLYNEDLWADPPASVLRFKDEIAAVDAVLLVTPEYNRATTPAMKNALDWGTRPYGKNVWKGKPAAIVGATPGAIGTAAAQFELRSIAAVVGLSLMAQPEIYFTWKAEKFDGTEVVDPDTRKFLSAWVDAFSTWVEKLA